MTTFFDVLIIIFLFTLFAASHTFLASSGFKQKLADSIGNKIAFYRLFYNISSLIVFAAVYAVSPKPEITLYDLHYPYDIVIFVVQALSLIGLIWAISAFDASEFIGINQIRRYLNNEYRMEDIDEKQSLNFKGPFKYSRHPVYFFSILFLGLRPTMSLFYFVMFVCVTVYFIVGSRYEEKKLVERFGESYLEYQKKVPAFVPYRFLNKNIINEV